MNQILTMPSFVEASQQTRSTDSRIRDSAWACIDAHVAHFAAAMGIETKATCPRCDGAASGDHITGCWACDGVGTFTLSRCVRDDLVPTAIAATVPEWTAFIDSGSGLEDQAAEAAE